MYIYFTSAKPLRISRLWGQKQGSAFFSTLRLFCLLFIQLMRRSFYLISVGVSRCYTVTHSLKFLDSFSIEGTLDTTTTWSKSKKNSVSKEDTASFFPLVKMSGLHMGRSVSLYIFPLRSVLYVKYFLIHAFYLSSQFSAPYIPVTQGKSSPKV